MKKIIILLTFLVMTFSANAKEFKTPMSPYQDNYIIAGDNDAQVKFQFSAKYNLLYPFNTGIYFGYTQRSYWRIYDESSPFVETNYMPEAFYRFDSGDNMFKNYVIPFVDYIQVSPVSHKSNGRNELNSRSINIYYGQIQMSKGDILNVGANIKVFGYYNKAKENKDINDYNKNYEADLFLKLRSKTVMYLDKEELHLKFGGNPVNKGWFAVEARVRLLSTYVQPKLFIQYREGYDEFMINYNEKEKSIRAGFIF